MRTSINLATKQIYNHGIVKCNPCCTYSPLVSNRDTFMLLTVRLCEIRTPYEYKRTFTSNAKNQIFFSVFSCIKSKLLQNWLFQQDVTVLPQSYKAQYRDTMILSITWAACRPFRPTLALHVPKYVLGGMGTPAGIFLWFQMIQKGLIWEGLASLIFWNFEF